MLRIQWRKEREGVGVCLRTANKKHAAGAQGKVENVEDVVLSFLGQVDEQVAAGDEIEPGKGRVPQEIVRGEEDLSRTSLRTR